MVNSASALKPYQRLYFRIFHPRFGGFSLNRVEMRELMVDKCFLNPNHSIGSPTAASYCPPFEISFQSSLNGLSSILLLLLLLLFLLLLLYPNSEVRSPFAPLTAADSASGWPAAANRDPPLPLVTILTERSSPLIGRISRTAGAGGSPRPD